MTTIEYETMKYVVKTGLPLNHVEKLDFKQLMASQKNFVNFKAAEKYVNQIPSYSRLRTILNKFIDQVVLPNFLSQVALSKKPSISSIGWMAVYNSG